MSGTLTESVRHAENISMGSKMSALMRFFFLIGSIEQSVFETLNSNKPWKYYTYSIVCKRLIHHTEKNEAVLATKGNFIIEMVEMYKSKCRTIGIANLDKTLVQLV